MTTESKEPVCPYGNHAKYVCVNSKCKKQGFICEKGESTHSECFLFHETCTKINWHEVEVFARENSFTKTTEFEDLRDKVEDLFLSTLKQIQFEHQKFKIWSKTYGHSLQAMKFIKHLMDKNYQHINGEYMASVLPDLLNREGRKIESPAIVESDFQIVKNQLDKVLENFSALYLKGKRVVKRMRHSDPHEMLNNSSSFVSNISERSEKVQSINSKILKSIASIEKFFDGKPIRKAQLLYRASEADFSVKNFHQKCDGIPHTLTVLKNEYGKILGGYTPVEWKSDKKHWEADKTLQSFIFSLDMNEKFKLNLAQFAIAINPEKGPTFGCCDICIVDNAHKEKSNCEFPISFNSSSKHTRNSQTSMLFTGNAKGQFLTVQWEVFRLEFQ